MKHKEEITFQTLAESDEVQIGYSDRDIVIIDSIQMFTEISDAHVAMNAVIICLSGKVQGNLNGHIIELHKNQIAIIPQNMTITNVMISPDFDCKGLFLTTSILQSFLRDQMSVWNAVMYIHRLNVITLEDDGIQFYNYFYNMIIMAINKFQNNPFQSEVVHALLRAAILAFCGNIKRNLPTTSLSPDTKTANIHFQRFLELLNGKGVKYRTVEAYANELCVSPKYISSICKKCSGKTANEWIRERILEEIRYYLQQTDLSNKEICDQIDFPNTSFFGKYVKEHFGMTPGEFRKSNCCK